MWFLLIKKGQRAYDVLHIQQSFQASPDLTHKIDFVGTNHFPVKKKASVSYKVWRVLHVLCN